MTRRVVITGLGTVSPIGNSPEIFFSSLMAGYSGIKHIKRDFNSQLSVRIAASIEDFVPSEFFSKIELNGLDRFSQFALVAAEQAMQDSKLVLGASEYQRSGVSIGSCVGGTTTLEEHYVELMKSENPRIRPRAVLLNMNNAAASHLSIKYNLQGANTTYSTACASSTIAIGEAYRQIKHGYADVMLTGGSEATLTLGAMKAWEALRTLAKEDPFSPAASCKPFSKNRSGLVMGEGAAILVLEDAHRALHRGAKIYAELIGYDCSSDARHITKPDSTGQARTILNALKDANLHPQDIDYINAHGTATFAGDIEETKAIKLAFGSHAYSIPISSTKSMHGHLMGATGAVEFMAAILSLKNQAIPPTINLNQADAECDLDYVANQGRFNVHLDTVMSNTFAFGGTNAVLIARGFK